LSLNLSRLLAKVLHIWGESRSSSIRSLFLFSIACFLLKTVAMW